MEYVYFFYIIRNYGGRVLCVDLVVKFELWNLIIVLLFIFGFFYSFSIFDLGYYYVEMFLCKNLKKNIRINIIIKEYKLNIFFGKFEIIEVEM